MLSTQQVVPSVHISVNKNRISHESDGNMKTVYMPGKQEFEIELTNPTDRVVLAKLHLNGKRLSSTGLVLRPGEHVYLERYLDDNKKFLFDTYSVENTQQIADAIKNNGLLKVTFHDEISPPMQISWTTTYSTPRPPWPPTTWYTTSGTLTSSTLGAYTTNVSSQIPSGPIKRGILTDASSKVDNNLLETGRVEKGSVSSQSFKYVDKKFETYSFHSEVIQLLPQSRYAGDIKVYCSNCGRRNRKGENFCPKCGQKRG